MEQHSTCKGRLSPRMVALPLGKLELSGLLTLILKDAETVTLILT